MIWWHRSNSIDTFVVVQVWDYFCLFGDLTRISYHLVLSDNIYSTDISGSIVVIYLLVVKIDIWQSDNSHFDCEPKGGSGRGLAIFSHKYCWGFPGSTIHCWYRLWCSKINLSRYKSSIYLGFTHIWFDSCLSTFEWPRFTTFMWLTAHVWASSSCYFDCCFVSLSFLLVIP
jgi:hypothetical protein